MQKIVVTGCNGMLGQTLVNLLTEKKGYTIYGLAKGANRNLGNDNFEYIDVDLVDFTMVNHIFSEIAPHIIVNCAAMTNVDLCETQQEACNLINTVLVKELAHISEKYKSHLVHISTDFIFDGKQGLYKENDIPNPVNYYGLSKLKAEQIITDSNISYSILRTILVFGKVDGMLKNNIVLWIKDGVESGETLTIVNDQFRMPTYVKDLAEACWQSIQDKLFGIHHISSSELLSIYEMALQVCDVFGLDKNRIKAIPTSQLEQVAMRPVKTGFDLQNSKKNFKLSFEPFKSRLIAFKKLIDSKV